MHIIFVKLFVNMHQKFILMYITLDNKQMREKHVKKKIQKF